MTPVVASSVGRSFVGRQLRDRLELGYGSYFASARKVQYAQGSLVFTSGCFNANVRVTIKSVILNGGGTPIGYSLMYLLAIRAGHRRRLHYVAFGCDHTQNRPALAKFNNLEEFPRLPLRPAAGS